MYRSVGDEPVLIITTPAAPPPPPPTPDQIIQFVTAGGCTQTLANEAGAPCLDKNWMSTLLQYKFGGGTPPQGVSAKTWKNFGAKADQCHWADFPLCASLDTQFGTNVPDCLTENQVKLVTYCDKYPLNDGPDRNLNVLCWVATKSGTLNYNMHTVPPCAPGAPGGAQAGMSPGLKLGLIGAAVVAGAFLLTRKR